MECTATERFNIVRRDCGSESERLKHVAYFHEINNESGFKWKTLLDLVTMEKIRLH